MFGYRDSRVKVTNSKIGGDTTIIGPSYITDSSISDDADVITSSIYDSYIAGYATIVSSALNHSHVSGHGKIIHGKMYKSCLCEGAKVNGGELNNATVYGRSMVIDATINGAVVRDEAIVSGVNTVVEGDIVIDGGMILHSGIWTRAPKILYAKLSNYTVQECVDGKIHINCTCNTPAKFLGGAGRRYSRMMGLTEEQTDEIESLTRMMRDLI